MAGGIAAALAGPAVAAVNHGGTSTSLKIPSLPNGLSKIPAWGLGIGLGDFVADSFLKKFPEVAGSEKDKEAVKYAMRSMMNEVTKGIGESLDYLKELDDDEEKCAATTLYGK